MQPARTRSAPGTDRQVSVFGYVTATITIYLVSQKTDEDKQDQAQDPAASTEALQSELAAVWEQLNTLLAQLDVPQSPPDLIREAGQVRMQESREMGAEILPK